MHSYPHCWRHQSPVMFRTTPQWFISMDQKGLRAHALRDIKGVKWTPAWGEQRITGMIADRPDWCISRQRTWGVPIALFVHKVTGELHPRTQELIEQVAARVATDGIEAWFSLDPARAAGRRGRRLREAQGRDGCVGGLGGVVRLHGARRAPVRRCPWICTWKAPTSIAAGSRARC